MCSAFALRQTWAAPVQYLAWRIYRRTRAFTMGRLGAVIGAVCTTFAYTTYARTALVRKTALTAFLQDDLSRTFASPLTAHPLRAGD